PTLNRPTRLLQLPRDVLVVLGRLVEELREAFIGHLGCQPAGDGRLRAVVERRVHVWAAPGGAAGSATPGPRFCNREFRGVSALAGSEGQLTDLTPRGLHPKSRGRCRVQGLTNFSTNSSFGCGGSGVFLSRGSLGLRRKVASSKSLNPAASTSS